MSFGPAAEEALDERELSDAQPAISRMLNALRFPWGIVAVVRKLFGTAKAAHVVFLSFCRSFRCRAMK